MWITGGEIYTGRGARGVRHGIDRRNKPGVHPGDRLPGLPADPGDMAGSSIVTSSEIPSVPVQDLPAEFDAAPSAGAGSGAGAPSAILLDVREADEWQLGHAPGALHIPMIDVPARLDELDYDADIYVVCRQGGRSIEVAKYLAYVGFEVYQVVGGMVAWQQAGRPLSAAGDHEAKIY